MPYRHGQTIYKTSLDDLIASERNISTKMVSHAYSGGTKEKCRRGYSRMISKNFDKGDSRCNVRK